MTLTKEQANKIKVTRDTEVGDLCSYEGAHHKICAENLAKWAYRRLETWPDLLAACEELPEEKSILAEAAYTGGDVPKKWIRDRGNFIEGYNQALKDVASLRKFAVTKAGIA